MRFVHHAVYHRQLAEIHWCWSGKGKRTVVYILQSVRRDVVAAGPTRSTPLLVSRVYPAFTPARSAPGLQSATTRSVRCLPVSIGVDEVADTVIVFGEVLVVLPIQGINPVDFAVFLGIQGLDAVALVENPGAA